MAIIITGIPRCSRGARPNRSIGFENEVRRYAQEFISRQEAGYITSRDLCAKLNDDGIRSKDGKPWSESKVSRMIRRGHELGLPFIRRGRSEAASLRRVRRRSAGEIHAQRSAGMTSLEAAVRQTDAGMIAPGLLLLKRKRKD
jgi:hypothetical protein